MVFSIGFKESQICLGCEGTKVTVTTSSSMGSTDSFLSFLLAQITWLTLAVIAKSVAAKIGEFTSLERFDLQGCIEEAKVLSDLSPSPGPGSLVPFPYFTAMKMSLNLTHFDGVDKILDIDGPNGWLGQPLVLE